MIAALAMALLVGYWYFTDKNKCKHPQTQKLEIILGVAGILAALSSFVMICAATPLLYFKGQYSGPSTGEWLATMIACLGSCVLSGVLLHRATMADEQQQNKLQ